MAIMGRKMPELNNERVSVEDLRRLVKYDPETGEFTHLRTRGRAVEGQRADTPRLHGYRSLFINSSEVLAHRAAWALIHGTWPASRLDHISLDKTDNRISNLRLATAMQNRSNTPVHKNNRLGVKGVAETAQGRFRATIKVGGKSFFLGVFDTIDEAKDAYATAAQKFFGSYARSDERSCEMRTT